MNCDLLHVCCDIDEIEVFCVLEMVTIKYFLSKISLVNKELSNDRMPNNMGLLHF